MTRDIFYDKMAEIIGHNVIAGTDFIRFGSFLNSLCSYFYHVDPNFDEDRFLRDVASIVEQYADNV